MPLRATFNEGNQNLSASFLNADTLDASLNATVYVPQVDIYVGPYEATPSRETQTLGTENLMMARNVTINPIPSNYGLITYNGSIITVS